MKLLRSIIFLLAQIIYTVLYALLSPFIFLLNAHWRFRVLIGFAHGVLWLLRVICGINMQVRGAEHIPAEACVVLSKHQSAWETLALQLVLPPHVWVVKRELLWLPFFGWLLALSSPIALNRGKGKAAMQQLLAQGTKKLQQGFSVVLFPEGTRMPYGVRGKYKIGGALLAEHSGATVLPVAHNAGKFWGRNAFIKHPGTITLSFGKPIASKGLNATQLNAQVEAWIETEMETLG